MKNIGKILLLLAIFAQNSFSTQDFSLIPWCEQQYGCGDEKNVACQYSGKCDIDIKDCELQPLDKEQIVDMHNMYRNQFAIGDPRTPKVNVANMGALRWDEGLAFLATCNLKPCSDDSDAKDACHNLPPKFPMVGQSLAEFSIRSGNFNCAAQTLTTFFSDWYEEINVMSDEQINEMMDSYKETSEISEDFTQMTWADTTHVGCALIRIKKPKEVITCQLTCNYGPGGNVIGSRWFKEGEPASECPKGVKSNSKYSGLCANLVGTNLTAHLNSNQNGNPNKNKDKKKRKKCSANSAKHLIFQISLSTLFALQACANIYLM